MLKDTVGQRKADWMLQLAQMLKPADAAAAGVVDEIVPLSHLHDASMAKMSELLQAPSAPSPPQALCARYVLSHIPT